MHDCDRPADRQNYDPQDRTSIAALLGKNCRIYTEPAQTMLDIFIKMMLWVSSFNTATVVLENH